MVVKWIITFLLLREIKSQTDPEFSEECIVDNTVSWEVEGNYVDCTSEENQAEGTTSCCKQEEEVGCCSGDKWDNIIQVATIIGSCTLTLALMMFVVMWCNLKTFPCMKKLKYKVETKYRKWEEKSCCCKKRVERQRKKEKQEDIPQYEVAQEMQGQVDDSFWGPV